MVGERQVKDLPLNGRSYDQLLTLNPGIVNYTSQRAGGIGTFYVADHIISWTVHQGKLPDHFCARYLFASVSSGRCVSALLHRATSFP